MNAKETAKIIIEKIKENNIKIKQEQEEKITTEIQQIIQEYEDECWEEAMKVIE